jgi:hypothetical protein
VRICTNLIVAILIAACSTSSLANDSNTVKDEQAAETTAALKLVDIIQPPSEDAAIMKGAMQQTFAELAESYKPLVELNVRHPGAIGELVDAIAPIGLRHMEQHMASYRAELADVYSAQFSERELQELIGFWSGPLAQKFLAKIRSNISVEQAAKDAASQMDKDLADIEISSKLLKQDFENTAHQSVAEMTAAEIGELDSFLTTPLGQKYMISLDAKDKIDAKYDAIVGSLEFYEPVFPEIREAIGKIIRRYDAEERSQTREPTETLQ